MQKWQVLLRVCSVSTQLQYLVMVIVYVVELCTIQWYYAVVGVCCWSMKHQQYVVGVSSWGMQQYVVGAWSGSNMQWQYYTQWEYMVVVCSGSMVLEYLVRVCRCYLLWQYVRQFSGSAVRSGSSGSILWEYFEIGYVVLVQSCGTTQ